MESVAGIGLWLGFAVVVFAALAVDLSVLRSAGAHRVSNREALLWSLAWVGLALLFNLGLWWWLGETRGAAVANEAALEFFTGYLVEKSLAVDNIFVFLMLFTYFAVPAEQQQRVLVYGILGAIVLRAVLILIGAALVSQYHWVLYFFGAFLLLTGIKMLLFANRKPDLERNPALRWMRAHLPLTAGYHGHRFRLRVDGVMRYTPLFVVLVLIGITDVIFAVDSIPAIFAITLDPFIVLTSNVFAVLGLRALYFLLAGAAERFHLLSYGLALVLMFIGTKMLIVDLVKIPIAVSLGTVALTIAASMLVSVLLPAHDAAGRPPPVS